MANYDFTRTIVKRGVIKLSSAQRQVTGFTLWFQAEREPGNAYKNFKFPQPESYYGVVQAMSRGYVVSSHILKYENQKVFDYRNPDQEQLLIDLCLFSKTMEAIGGPIGGALTEIFGFASGGNSLNLSGFPVTPEAVLQRWEIDSFLVRLFNDTTGVFRVFGQYPPNECNLPVDWREPVGPPAPSPDNPYEAVEPPSIPVNEFDPSGLDLPDAPYDRDTDDNGYSYDPEREEDQLPSGVGLGYWDLIVKVQPRESFPPYAASGPVEEITRDIGQGYQVANPAVTGYYKGNPDVGVNQVVCWSWTSDQGAPGNRCLQFAGGRSEVVGAEIRQRPG